MKNAKSEPFRGVLVPTVLVMAAAILFLGWVCSKAPVVDLPVVFKSWSSGACVRAETNKGVPMTCAEAMKNGRYEMFRVE